MNRTISIAIASALLALSQGGAAHAATPLATRGVAAKPTDALQRTRPPGDFDRAFIAQRTVENQPQPAPQRNFDSTNGSR